MNILLICGGGFSSGFLVQNMKKAAQQLGGDIAIDARSETELSGLISTPSSSKRCSPLWRDDALNHAAARAHGGAARDPGVPAVDRSASIAAR